MQKDVYLCFIDDAKACDKLCHKELLEQLDNLDVFRKLISIIQTL